MGAAQKHMLTHKNKEFAYKNFKNEIKVTKEKKRKRKWESMRLYNIHVHYQSQAYIN